MGDESERRRLKGRGALSNPPGRFDGTTREDIDDGWYRDEEPDSIATSIEPDNARSIITRNDSPDVGFEYSINPYRGCEHGCVYCLSGDTPILMSGGTWKRLGDVRTGDEIYGTEKRGHYRRYVRTRVIAHWLTRKPAYRILAEDGTEVVASADHRFLTERGWKFVGPATRGQRPCLTPNDTLMGFGNVGVAWGSPDCSDYRRGYLCGLIRGDGLLKVHHYSRAGGPNGDQYRFRLAMIDCEALDRAQCYLADFGIGTDRFLFQPERPGRKRIDAIRTSAHASMAAIGRLIAWPDRPEGEWARGFAAGVFDVEGSFSDGTIRIANTDPETIRMIVASLNAMAFDTVIETRSSPRPGPLQYVRIKGGLRAHLRFFGGCGPVIRRKRSIAGQAVKSAAALAVAACERVGVEQEMFDITTGTGDFIANGVISHNCYARPSHSYVGLSPGIDFETKLFYKADAARLLEAELAKPRYVCKPIMVGANTDPYQPVERRLRVTRGILEVLARCRHPVGVITKSAGIARDIDLLADLARDGLASVMISLTTLDRETKRTLEPRAAAPEARLSAMRQLAAAGVPVGVMAAPVIPAVTDHELERILEAAAAAGASSAGYVMLRLPYEVKDLFREWLAEHHPQRAGHVMSLVQALRGGRDNDPRFGTRMRGEGPFAELIRGRFRVACRRLGFESRRDRPLDTTLFRPPRPASPQLSLGIDADEPAPPN